MASFPFTYGVVCELDVPHTVAYVKWVPPVGTPRKRREETAEATKIALIDAAAELFASVGLDASLDAICERAGYTRGAFYVHFADRDALLVAVMEKVGATFLAQMFEAAPAHTLAAASERFVGAVAGGTYPLMGAGKAQIRFHQLLDACARSPKVREQYRTLVEASVEHVASLARHDPTIRSDLDPMHLGRALLAAIIGAQTMAELGVEIDPHALATTLLTALAPNCADCARLPSAANPP
jgi:AcrR family transcriptional regulator